MEPNKKKYTLAEDNKMIDEAFAELLDGYMNSNHRKKDAIIRRAFEFARKAHEGGRRLSGEPYIMHPIAVARIVSQEIGLGSTSICAALLHDVVEDTDCTVEDVESQFGSKIAKIVEGLTKISGGILGERASEQAENFRKLLLSMSEDIRVILIKMADRLHNMRTLDALLPSKQYKIAGETLYVYAPLAHRLGLFAIKTELEVLSFKYEHPADYAAIMSNIVESDEQRNAIFEKFSAPIRERLDAMGLKYTMKARVKSAYSIWNKMQKKKVPFSEVYDLYAARIVFDCENEADEKLICWHIYSEITDLYSLHPERTRDWISVPKVNGYRALHLTVMGPDGNWIEVQIRSKRMDEIAERGFAAHWKYKDGDKEDEELSFWLRTIQEILDNPEPNTLDFLDTIKLNLYASEIVVFSPKGEVITMPKDATVLDFAFNIHSQLGTHCLAGKVNHKLVPLSQTLNSGDQVEILTSETQHPSEEWLEFVNTARGKTRLRTALRRVRRAEIASGERMFRAFMETHKHQVNNDMALNKLMSHYGVRTRDEFYYAVNHGKISLDESTVSILANRRKRVGIITTWLKQPFKKLKAAAASTTAEKEIDTRKVYELRTVNNESNYVLADCCHPILGDDVVGVISDDNKVIVHRHTCSVAQKLKLSQGNRLLSAQWCKHDSDFLAKMRVEGIDYVGVLHDIVEIISHNFHADVRNMSFHADNGIFHANIDLLVSDTEVFQQICSQLTTLSGVHTAVRSD